MTYFARGITLLSSPIVGVQNIPCVKRRNYDELTINAGRIIYKLFSVKRKAFSAT